MKIYVNEIPDCKHDCPFQDFCGNTCDRFEKDGVTKTEEGKFSFFSCNLLEVKEYV